MRRNQGYTITELMITVVIIGVLATLAIPTFTSYIYKGRVTEATNFLGKIKQRQESYRNEFGQYCDVSEGPGWTNWNPAGEPSEDPVVWVSTDEWQQLAASPNAPVRFRYATVAGGPGDPVPADSGLDNSDHWFAARAEGDLNGDNEKFYLEIYSQADHIFNEVHGVGGWR